MRNSGRGRPRHPDVLTPTEWRVLDAVRHGMSRREIARRRGTSVDAVRYHLRNISDKLGVGGSSALRQWEGYPMTTSINPAAGAQGAGIAGLGQVSLFVRETERAVAFYRDVLGLPHLYTFGALAFFDIAGVRLYLHTCGDEEWRPGSVLYFTVDDIAGAYAALQERKVKTSGAPHLIHTDEATGVQEWMAFFEDTEGNTLALMSRVSPQ